MALNEELDWAEVGNYREGEGKVSDCFKIKNCFQDLGPPTRERLNAGMVLYKFSGRNTIQNTKLSPWWSPKYSFKHDAGLEQRILVAQKLGVTLREWGRLTSVIKEEFSSMEWLLTIELSEDVYGWFGAFKGMGRHDEGKKSLLKEGVEPKGLSKNLPGGGTQFYIPNLTPDHIRWSAIRPM